MTEGCNDLSNRTFRQFLRTGSYCKICVVVRANIKTKETCLKIWGIEHSSQVQEIKEKIKQTNLEKYGCKSDMQNKEVRENAKQTCLHLFSFKTPILYSLI